VAPARPARRRIDPDGLPRRVIQLPRECTGPWSAVLLFGAWRLGTSPDWQSDPERTRVPVLGGLAIGGLIGLLAGLTGTGGGIFLTPILVLAGWARSREAAGLSGAFILANSASGLAGVLTGGLSLPAELPLWLLAVAWRRRAPARGSARRDTAS
jgi:uncharacterized protein